MQDNLLVWVLNVDQDNRFSNLLRKVFPMIDRNDAILEIKSELLHRKLSTTDELDKLKREISKKYKLKDFPKNSEILAVCSPEEKEKLLPILMIRKVRTLSGVAIVAVMTRPWECPHGKCIMCPGGPDVEKPQSYTGYEPTSMRGIEGSTKPSCPGW